MIEAEHGRGEKTIIVIRGAVAEVWTSVPQMARKLDRLCQLEPEEVRLTQIHRYGEGIHQGLVDWKSYEVKSHRIQIMEEQENV